jgi:hypothetical protein
MRNHVAVCLTAAALLSCATADLRGELEAMYDTDQGQRAKLQSLAQGGNAGSAEFIELVKQQQAIDTRNVQRFKELVAKYGWPKKSIVGEKASVAAFLVVQHADASTQKEYLPLLRESVAAGEARPEDLALLEDRVLMGEGRKQRYGSQLQPSDSGGWEFYPIEDEQHVDERRRAVGLPPLAEYAKQMGVERK